MTKEELIKLGLTEEQAAAVAQRFAEAAEESASAKKQIAELAKKSEAISAELESIRSASGKAESDYAELKKKYEDDTAALRAEKDNAEKNYLIDSALTARRAKNLKAAKALLDLDKVSLKDGKLEGLDEQLETAVKDNGYMFGEEKQMPQFVRSTQVPSGLDGADGKGLTYSQMMAIRETNPTAEF